VKRIKVKDIEREVGDGIDEEDLIKLEKRYIREEIVDFIYMFFILIVFCIAIIELKTAFNIDVFPDVDIPIDDIYYEIKE
jgi:hypothetical protein